MSEPQSDIRAVVCTFFYYPTPVERLSLEILDTFLDVAPQPVNRARPLTLSNLSQTVSLSIFDDFLELRSNEETWETKEHTALAVLTRILRQSTTFKTVGTVLRIIALLHYGDGVDLVQILQKLYLAGMSFAADALQAEPKGLSMKFYFDRAGHEWELDIGNYQLGRQSLYIELEGRMKGELTEAGFLELWRSLKDSFGLSLTMARQIVQSGTRD